MAHALKVPKAKKKSPAELAVQRRRAAAERMRGMFADLTPGRSMVDELIAERRREARAEARDEAAAARAKRRSAQR